LITGGGAKTEGSRKRNMERKSGLDALEAAIKFEDDGRKFFLDASKKTKHRYGQLMFQSIADAELEHIERIQEVYDCLTRTGDWPDRPSLFTPKGPLKNIFEGAREQLDQNVKVETDDIDAVTMAREYEEKGLWFYQDLADRAEALIEKKFYHQLAYEERGHLLIFQDMREYYIDPVHWFSEKEKLHWDGA
jgi:rubrerythrin